MTILRNKKATANVRPKKAEEDRYCTCDRARNERRLKLLNDKINK